MGVAKHGCVMEPLNFALDNNNIFDIDVDGLITWKPTIWRHDSEFPLDSRLFADYENPQSLKSLAFRAIGDNWLRFDPFLEVLQFDLPKQRVYTLNIQSDLEHSSNYQCEYQIQFQVSFVDNYDDRFDILAIMKLLYTDPYWLYGNRDFCLVFTLNSSKRMEAEMAFNFGRDMHYEYSFARLNDSKEQAEKPIYRYLSDLLKDMTSMAICKNLADFQKAYLLRQGIEPNPGPASVEFVNLASRNYLLQDQTINQCAIEEDGKLTWYVQIILNKYPSLSSVTFSSYNKKIAYELCYEQIMAKIVAKMTNNCFDLQPEMKQAFDKRRVNVVDAVHQSELPTEGSHGETTAETLSALQTNLVTTTEESSGVPTSAEVSEQMMTTTENIGDYDNLTGQWYLIDEFEWGVTSPSLIREYVLPRDILASNIAANSPPLIPFNVNYLWSGCIEVRIQTKAQMFLTGQLQICSFYELDADADAQKRRNVYSGSQTNHVLVNAGGSNDAVLRIPYVYRQPYTQIKQDSLIVGNNSCLSVVNVLIQVLNALKVGTGSSDVSVAVFVRFVESKFTGKRDGAIGNFDGEPTMSISDARHEMMSMLADVASVAIPGVGGMIGTGIRMAEKVLREKKKTKNRDNPPVTGPTDLLIPYSAQTWASGTNIGEPIRTLRLDPVGQTPHPDYQEQISQMSQIAQIFGLFRQIQWNENQDPGTTLLIVPCTPLMTADHYQLSSEDTANQLRFVPPVGVVTSMYNLFRGPLEFRLDVIANKFYLGGLIMGYIPGIDEGTIVTNQMLRNSAFTTYSLDANNLSITYETPFVNSAKWYNTPFAKPYNNAYARLPGCFVVNVLQRLQQPEAVNAEIDINVYMAAGSGFECSVLTQPALVVPSDATFVVNPLTVFNPINFPPPTFLGSRPDTNSGFGTLDPIALTLGGGSGVFAAWNIRSDATSFIAYADPPFTLTGSTGAQVYEYFLALRVNGSIRMYCIAQTIPAINIFISALNSIPYSDDPSARGTLAMITGGPGQWQNVTGVGFANTLPHLRAIWTQGQSPLITDIVDAEHESERDLEPNLVTSVQHYTTDGWGMSNFGENFGDVIDLLRRPVYHQDFTYVDSAANKFPNALFKLRVSPIPPLIDLEDPFDLVNRSSHTKIILSGYRYYRGGMRYRLVMPYLPGVYVWTQYDSSDKIAVDALVYPTTGVPTPILTHSNPLDLLTLQVNQVINVEVPWYNSNSLNYLQTVNFTNLDADQINATALGTLTVGLSTNKTETIPGSYTINVYSKVADDFAPYVFQGFPPMSFQSFLNPTEPVMAEHEMMRSVVGNNIIKPIVSEVESEISRVASDIRVQIGDVTNSIGEALSEIIEKIKKSANINLDFNWNIVITDLVSQLGHCIMNPNLKTFIWSIITMLTKIGILSYNVIGKAVDLFNKICTSIFGIYDRVTNGGTQQEPATVSSAEHNGPSLSPSQTLPLPLDDVLVNNTAEFWSLIVASLAGLIGFGASAKYFNAKSFAWSLSRSLREFTMTANGLTSFLKLHLDTIKKVLKSMCFWKSVEEFDPESMIVYNKSFIETWCKEVSYLTAPGMDTKIIGDSYLSDRVYLAFMIGEVIAKNVIAKTENKTNNSVLTTKLNAIRKLHEQCIMAGKTGAVRRETFGVWIDGEAGIGKSYIVEEISTRLLLRGDIRFEGEKTLTLNAADKYWSRCNKQPVLWIDDVFQCQTEEMIQSHLNAIFSVMSPTPLCPPMADLKDKDRIYEPRIMMMTANSAFPNVKQVSSKAALWRRRHALIKCRMDHDHCRQHDPDYAIGKEVKDLPAAATANYQHLWFSFAKNPKKQDTQWIGPYKYEKAMEYLDELWDAFDEQSLRSYNHRLNKYYEAKRQVLPDYLNDMPNVPKHSNLFTQIKELATRLDASALSIDEIHWNEMMEAKREKWVDKIFNVPKKMLALLVGRYPMFTYGVNSILTGHFPNRKGYNRYTAHGLGWDDPKHSSLCPAWDKPPLITGIPKNDHGRIELGFNPLSKNYRDIVRKSHELRCFGLTSEQAQQVEFAMGRDDIQRFADELQQDLIDLDDTTDDEDTLFDFSDIAHNMEDNDDLKPLISSIGDRIRDHFLGQSDRLMLLLGHVCSFRKTLKKSDMKEILNFFASTLNMKTTLSVSQTTMLMYSKLAQYKTCSHFSLCKDFVYMRDTNKFVKVPNKYDDVKKFEEKPATMCGDQCALNLKLFKDHIYGMVRCPQGLPEDCSYGIDAEVAKLLIDDVETFKDKCLSKLKTWCSTLWNFLCEHYKSVLAVIGVVTAAWFMFFKPDNVKQVVSEGAAYDKNKKLVEKRKITSKRKLIKHSQAKEKIIVGEHEANQNVGDVMRKLTQNIVFLQLTYTWENIPKTKKYRVVMLRERQCLMIRHYIEDIQFYADKDPNAKLCMLVNGNNEVPLPINCVDEFSVLENQDETDFNEDREGTGYVLYNGLCVVDLPKTVRQFPTITHHFVTEKDELRMSNNGIILMPELGKGSLPNSLVCERVKFSNYDNLVINAADTTSAVHLERVWMYNGVHGYGLCGSLLLNEDSGKIIGIHTAGSANNNLGFSERLVYEEWEFVDEQAKLDVFVPNLEPITLDDHTLEGAVFPLGKVPRMYAQQNSGISQIKKSVIHGVVPVKTEPAPLTPFDKRLPEGCSPLYDGVAIHGLPPKEFPPDAVDKAREDLRDLLLAKCIPVRPVQMLTMEEAVCGNPLIGLESIPLDTSEGYPLNKLRPKGCKGKGWLFNIERDEHSVVTKMQIHPELEKIMKVKDAMRMKGIKPFTVFSDVLKDETLPKAKCRKKAGTRIISMSPVDFTIQSRQVFGDFILAHAKCRADLEHSIGVNTYSDEWTRIAKDAQRKGRKIVAGDHSKFGPRMMTIVSEAVFKCIYDWYEFHGASADHLKRLEIMASELMNSVHLVFDILYQVMCGIISGSLFTAVFNSLCNNMYFRVAWLMITKRSFEEYYQHMYCTTYGDDNFNSVSDEISEEFNVRTLHKFFAEYDLSYTDVHKNTSDDMEKYCDLKDTSFLKTGWKDHPLKAGYYLPTLDKDSIENQLNWITVEGDAVENTITNCKSALRQAFGHGKEYYDELANKIKAAFARQGHRFMHRTWEEQFVAIDADYHVIK